MAHHLKMTIEFGFFLSFLAASLWGVWSLQHGLRHMLSVRREEDVVSRFGPHFRDPNLVINSMGNWILGPGSVNQSFAGSYLMMEGCVSFCDVVAGTGMVNFVIFFFILFSNHFFCGTPISASRLKGRVKFWLSFWIVATTTYVGGFTVDAGNILLMLPPEAHGLGVGMIGLRLLLLPLPCSHLVFIVLWYRKLRHQGANKGDSSTDDEGFNNACSCTEWGAHIFHIVGFLVWVVAYVWLIFHVKSLYSPRTVSNEVLLLAYMAQSKEQHPFLNRVLTTKSGFTLSFLAMVIWGVWSFQNGVRHLLDAPSEEDVVERFGPHFKEYSFVVNGFGNWLVGATMWNQSFAKSYMMMEGCVDFCDMLTGSGVLALILPFLIIFHTQACTKGSTSKVKAWLKAWSALLLVMFVGYIGGFTIDAGNVVLTLPHDAHWIAYRMIGLRYLLAVIPMTHVLFSYLWYRTLHAESQDEDFEKEALLQRWNRACSCTEWGWHIFWLIYFFLAKIMILTIYMVDLRTLFPRSPE